MSPSVQPSFSEGSDELVLGRKLEPLLVSGGGRWILIPSGEGLERSFKFRTFAKTWVGPDIDLLTPSMPRLPSPPKQTQDVQCYREY